MTWNRRQVLGATPGLAAMSGVARGAIAPTNVLILTVDALPAQVVGPHRRDPGGTWSAVMPRLGRLAKDGFVFRSARAVHPEPGPAAAAMWMGRPGSETGAMRTGQPASREMPLLVDHIAESGGADVFVVGGLGVPGRRPGPRVAELLSSHPVDNRAVATTTAAALSNQPPGRPWLGVVRLTGLSQLEATAGAWKALERSPDFGLPDRELPPAPDRAVPEAEPARIGVVDRPDRSKWDDATWRHLLWSAARTAGSVDRHIGDIIDVLDSTVHAAHTLVIVAAHCGHPLGRHGLDTTGTPYSHTLDVPLVMRAAGVAGGVDALVSTIDLAPTVCDVLGVPQLPDARGYSVRPLLDRTAGTWRRSVVSESHIDARTIRTAEFAYTRYPDGGELLFHTRNDPEEARNLAIDTGYASTVADHRARLDDHATTLAPTPAAEAGWPSE